MPIYEYTCTGCKARFEEITTSANAAAPPHCPQCHSTEVVKTISAPSALPSSGSTLPMGGVSGGCGGSSGFS
ncbi:MAG: transcriptional regulator [Desulfobulbus propionicus]|nr:MAG: transcriptional regulator [Desulfobulbus propionicus]